MDPLAKDLILSLLVLHPDDRLGYNGPEGVKQHPYLADLDWSSLLRYKAEFIPRLENDEDTSYFDTRVDRYNHEFEDTDTDDSPILSSKYDTPNLKIKTSIMTQFFFFQFHIILSTI